jgi:hypothetical protein
MNNIDDILSDEEKQFIAKLQQKISDHLKTMAEHKYDHLDNDEPLDLAKKHPEVIPPTRVSKNPHEIRITIHMETSSVDEKGYLLEVKDITKKYYHIPVPTGAPYEEYIDSFLKFFEQKLTETCQNFEPKNNV